MSAKPPDLADAVLAEVDRLRGLDALPVSGRFVYYALVARRVIPKATGRGAGKVRSDCWVNDALTDLREEGAVGWDEIADRSRRVIDLRGDPSVADALRSVAMYARLDPWDTDEPILACESESAAGVLEPVAAEYCVPLVPLKGQASAGLLGNALRRFVRDGTQVLYVGDYDWHGGLIEKSARKRLEEYCEVALDWRRIALTAEQVEEHVPAGMQIEDAQGRPKIEVEALSVEVLLRDVRAELDALLPEPLAVVRTREAEQRAVALQRLG